MYSDSGLRTFYRGKLTNKAHCRSALPPPLPSGLTPALLAVVPLTGFMFTSYGLFSYLWEHTLGKVGGAHTHTHTQ